MRAARETRALVTVEDHWAEGGIGEVVATALADAGVEHPAAPPRRLRATRQRPAGGAAGRRRDRRRAHRLRRGAGAWSRVPAPTITSVR